MKKSNTAEKVEQDRGKDRNGDVLEISRHCSCAGPEFPSMLNPGKGFCHSAKNPFTLGQLANQIGPDEQNASDWFRTK